MDSKSVWLPVGLVSGSALITGTLVWLATRQQERRQSPARRRSGVGLIRDPNPASGFQVSSEIKRPPKQTESKDASLYASSQAGLFNPEVSCEAVVTSAVIDSIKTFRVPNVRDWLGELPKYENKFFRTRSGSEGKLGYSHRVDHHQIILMDLVRKTNKSDSECLSFARAGPRDYTVFHPSQIKAAIVTCGGLCPGLNDVIYELTQMLYCTLCSHFVVSEGDVDNYGVDDIFGIRNGYRGFYDPAYHPYLTLDPDSTKDIHKKGGTMLGSSRGGFDKVKIIDACIKMGINQVYVIGGDGTHRGASELAKEARERNLLFTVVGIPKTIDNDIALIDRSFGFDTAVEEAVKAIDSVRIESECVPNGIGIVKLMGRHAGFIAAHATLANRNVDLCLIPEVPVELEGERGILSHIERTLESVGRCVIVLAEGAGGNLLSSSAETDESGNKKLAPIGDFLRDVIIKYFKDKKIAVNMKYNDPSYMIRSVAANAADSVYCMILAQNAVHGAMAGYTGFTSAMVNNRTVMIPMDVITRLSPTSLNPHGRTWERVTRSTHQPE